jgi:hypothetical protein
VAEEEPEALQEGDLDGEVADPDGREEEAVAPARGQAHAAGDEEAQREVDAQKSGGADRGGEEEEAQLHHRHPPHHGPMAGEEVPPAGVLEEEGTVVGGRRDVEGVGGHEGPLLRRVAEVQEDLVDHPALQPLRQGLRWYEHV